MHETVITQAFAILVSISLMIILWLFSQYAWVINNRNHAAKIIKIYSISTVLTALTVLWLVSIGAILKESGSAIPIQGGPQISSVNTLISPIFDIKVSSWCDRSFKQIIGESALDIIQMELDLRDGATFIGAILAIIVLPRLLSGAIIFYMFDFKPRFISSLAYKTVSILHEPSDVQKLFDKIKSKEYLTFHELNDIEKTMMSLSISITDPWKYFYAAIEKVIIIFAAILTAIVPVAKLYMWTPMSWVLSISFPIMVTTACLIAAITVSIGTSIVDEKMRNISWLKWLV